MTFQGFRFPRRAQKISRTLAPITTFVKPSFSNPVHGASGPSSLSKVDHGSSGPSSFGNRPSAPIAFSKPNCLILDPHSFTKPVGLPLALPSFSRRNHQSLAALVSKPSHSALISLDKPTLNSALTLSTDVKSFILLSDYPTLSFAS